MSKENNRIKPNIHSVKAKKQDIKLRSIKKKATRQKRKGLKKQNETLEC